MIRLAGPSEGVEEDGNSIQGGVRYEPHRDLGLEPAISHPHRDIHHMGPGTLRTPSGEGGALNPPFPSLDMDHVIRPLHKAILQHEVRDFRAGSEKDHHVIVPGEHRKGGGGLRFGVAGVGFGVHGRILVVRRGPGGGGGCGFRCGRDGDTLQKAAPDIEVH